MKKPLFIALFTISNFLIIAQSKGDFTVSLNHVALSVKDVNRSAQFYTTMLNLNEITNRTEMPGIRWFSLGDNKELHLISTIKETVLVNKAVHLALTTTNFELFVNHLQANKIAFSDWPGKLNEISKRADGIQQVFFQDPDGYWIEMNSVGY